MEATVEPRDSGQIVLRIVIVLRNVGGSRSGPMSVAGYSMDPIQLANLSADEPRFKYEAYIPENRFPIDEVPVGFASQFEVAFALKAKIPGGSYPFLMKIFYGSTGNKMVKAQFNVLIKE